MADKNLTLEELNAMVADLQKEVNDLKSENAELKEKHEKAKVKTFTAMKQSIMTEVLPVKNKWGYDEQLFLALGNVCTYIFYLIFPNARRYRTNISRVVDDGPNPHNRRRVYLNMFRSLCECVKGELEENMKYGKEEEDAQD